MTRKRNPENERIKRRYLIWLGEAKRCDPATIDKAAAAILKFENSTDYRSFKRFNIEHAIAFKRQLAKLRHERTGAPLSKATIDSTLRAVKAFFLWLADQAGYRSRIRHSDADYFNLSAKDVRVAHAERETPFPTLAQCRHAFALMPDATEIDRRNRAIFALLMLTGARDGAAASLRLKRVDLLDRSIHQDARDVKTKFAKSFTTWFFPVDADYLDCLTAWVVHLRETLFFGHDDALFPRPEMGMANGQFATIGLSREPYANAGKIREVIKGAFSAAGFHPYGPHSLRKTLGILANEHCRTPEQFKAWSMNLGHEHIATTLSAYCPVSPSRQGELILAMGRPGEGKTPSAP